MTKPWPGLHRGLEPALAANSPGSGVDHVLIALPSFSLGESLLAHYGDRIPSLEHRYLLAAFSLIRIQTCEFVFVCSVAPTPDVIEYYVSLVPDDSRADVRRRLHIVEVNDSSTRSVAAKLLDRPDLVADLRRRIGNRPAVIEPWNVTSAEVELARQLDAPINGTSPELWPIGFKSAGRVLMRSAGVPVPIGCEGLHSVDDVLAAVAEVRSRRPQATGVVIKSDDSGAGDGNKVIRFAEMSDVRAFVEGLPDWYLADLRKGCVVEELIVGDHISSPSVQADVEPNGKCRVLSTHEQVLGGANEQVYLGCRFPADARYSARLATHAKAVGGELAELGACGRIGVDFMARRNGTGGWDLYALEINLRKGGTTHPFAALRNLVPGHYDERAGQWIGSDGSPRYYSSTDNVVDPSWTGRDPLWAIQTIKDADLQFDSSSGCGVVPFMLSGLAIDGRLGLIAIAATRQHAEDLFADAQIALSGP